MEVLSKMNGLGDVRLMFRFTAETQSAYNVAIYNLENANSERAGSLRGRLSTRFETDTNGILNTESAFGGSHGRAESLVRAP